MNRTATTLFMVLLLLAGIILLQIFLSKRENKWLGHILPIITFLFSLIYPFNMVAPTGVDSEIILLMLFVLLMANIPTIIFVVIYFSCREKWVKENNLIK